jgi:dihydropyrimidinase
MNATIDLIVRGGTIVESEWQGLADLYISDGVVAAVVAPNTPPPAGSDAARVIDATGLLVLPGGVDPHCHVGFTSGDYTSLDGYEECTRAAVFGGTTTIVDFAIPRDGEAPLDAARRQRAKADQGLCDSALHASVVEWDSTVPAQLRTLCEEGIVTVKMFTTYRGESMASTDTILRTMQALQEVGGMVVIHCEANAIIEEDQRRSAEADKLDAAHMAQTRSELAEAAAVAEILAVAERLNAPVYFVHQSTPAVVDLVASARRRGVKAYTEAVAHHLVLDDSKYLGEHPERYVCCPPLRSRATVEGLGRYLFNGEITTIGSDHCCYDSVQKTEHKHDVRHMPNGLPGVETRLPVIFSEYVSKQNLSASQFVKLTASNPARANGIYPRKGALLPGSDADFALWDPTAEWTVRSTGLHMKTDYTPYEGMKLVGRPVTVAVRGQVVVTDGILTSDGNRGKHIPAGHVDLNIA